MTDTDLTANNLSENAKRREDVEWLRELLYKSPKKFEDVGNAYKAALRSDEENIKNQAAYYLDIIAEIKKDEDTKEKVRKEKELSMHKLEKDVRRLEKQALKLTEKGEREKAEKIINKADEKRETLHNMQNSGEKDILNNNKANSPTSGQMLHTKTNRENSMD